MDLFGQHYCKADAKGRVTLPTALKNQLMSVLNDDFILKRAIFQRCLELYPKSTFQKALAEVKRERRISREYDLFYRKYMAGVKPDVRVDADTGRFQIPKDLLEFAGITKEVSLHCGDGCIEIWDKQQYEEVLKEGDAVYPDVAESIFNKPNTEPKKVGEDE
ncbi:Cell division protein MraZ [Croceitalea dokdonensis DOKDO 023]|uniref:Transcriptional regulator MraZ n=1 Tax=Croceitalea dokdonensis DOKDO 023 TaxID=1300341 RepID=A0A0P7A6J1_9FLAO|nr:division/cell wall cluster transcriptional repressor MraZ [Croceitalea dokdonensis]KPM32366.1 Cell division protein MraZ [Croceitalea dokdonensis DOKDO 023]